MAKKIFEFKNRNSYTPIKKTFLFYQILSRFLLFGVLFSFFLLVIFKHFEWLKPYKKSFFYRIPLSQKKTIKNPAHSLPLFVSLKGTQGPEVVRLYIYLGLKDDLKKDILFKEEHLEKHILFLLSGQSTQELISKKDHFEKKIRLHLNSYLSRDVIHKVDIKTKFLN